jgi:hypothetical protein
MPNSTVPTKNTGDTLSAAEVNNIVTAVNSKAETKTDVGLGNVDNTSDANKPVSTATATALALKAPLDSPALTGTPTVPTLTAGDNSTKVANSAFVQTEFINKSIYFDANDFAGNGTSGTPITAKEKKAGDLTLLTTTDKSDLVHALNEVRATGGGGGGVGDRRKMVNATSFSIGLSTYLNINLSTYSASYNKISVRFFDVISTANNDELHMQVSSDGGTTYDSGATNYLGTAHMGDASFNPGSNGTYLILCTNVPAVGTAPGEVVHGDVHAFRANITTNKPEFRWELIQARNDGTDKPITGGGRRNAIQATTHLRFFTNGGTITGYYEVWVE